MPAGRVILPSEIEFVVAAFDEKAGALGLVTIADKARFVRVDHGHFYRIWHGQKSPGAVFVGRVLNAPWPDPVTFEEFFRYREVPT